MQKKWADAFWPTRAKESDNDQLSVKSLMEPQLSDANPIYPQRDAGICKTILHAPRDRYFPAGSPSTGRLPEPEPVQSDWGHPHSDVPSDVLAPNAPPYPNNKPTQQERVDTFDQSHKNTLSTLDRLNVSPAETPQRQDSKSDLAAHLPTAVREQYAGSIERLETNIYGIAEAVSSLDGIDLQLLTAKEQIQKLRLRGEPIDYTKVKRVLEEMGLVIGDVIDDLDQSEVNLLRDAKVRIAFQEVGADAKPVRGVDLNLISLEKLIKLSRTLDNDPQQIDRYIDALTRALDSNIQVLSSLMLTLFAARDYTNSVTEIALEAGVMKRLKDARANAGESAPVCLPPMRDERKPSHPNRSEWKETGDRKDGQKSLLQLLQKPIREN